MAVKNSAVVYIDGINYTHYVVMPLKWGDYLDETLDEMYLSLRRVPKKLFAPLTPVEVVIKNTLYFGGNTMKENEVTKRYLIADQPSSAENPIGSGKYDHNLHLIELTKYAERIIVDSLTFTNVNRRFYAQTEDIEVEEAETENVYGYNDYYQQYKISNNLIFGTNNGNGNYTGTTYLDNPVDPVTGYSKTINELIYIPNDHSKYIALANYVDDEYCSSITLADEDGNVLTSITATEDNDILDKSISLSVTTEGTYTLTYRVLFWFVGTDNYAESYGYLDIIYTLNISTKRPLKKWTITDVIDRLCDVCEPIREGETPRFRLNSDQAEKFDTILAPQFSFTKQTLRECLQDIGGVIHGEPRLSIGEDDDGYYYEISYDLYGGTEEWKWANLRPIARQVTQSVDEYTSYIDTAAENLVNAIGANSSTDESGTIIEPYSGGGKTLRCETLYERITEDNMIIPTQFPIYTVEKLEVAAPNDTTFYDITAYVFESTLYNSQLSSYSGTYPYSKAYGLMFTQGEKNITQLNFKQEDPIDSSFENYAIVNILVEASGNTVSKSDISGDEDDTYPLIAFRITYTPFYSSRIAQTKPYYLDFPRGTGLVYNQQSNVIESRFYGENLKGAIARMGNAELSLTYNLALYEQIPKAGQLFDEDYYISTVETEFLPTYIKCTVGLSKDFNRLSEYVGISNEKRYSEVSQSQATERNVLYREFVVIGDEEDTDEESIIGLKFMEDVWTVFGSGTVTTSSSAAYSNVICWGTDYSGNELNYIQLPVVSSAFGNSLSYSWEYEDNYSAGTISQYQLANSVSGYFQNSYPYCDYYGRLYYYNFMLMPNGTTFTSDIGKSLPKYDEDEDNTLSTSTGYYLSSSYYDNGRIWKPFIMRKDNREQIAVNVQVDFVTNDKDIIIGSTLAMNCLKSTLLGVKIYFFDEKLDKFINHVDGDNNVSIDFSSAYNNSEGYEVKRSTLSNPSGQFYLYININDGYCTFPVSGKSWAIVTNVNEETTYVQDEKGNLTTQTVSYGGDVLLAKNVEFSAGDEFPPVYFTKKRDVFDKSVWVDKK